jgi:hypothetical protein
MRSRRFHAFAIVIAGTLLLGAGSAAQAQVVSAGPYYAQPSWDQTLPCETPAGCTRFIVLSNMNSDAVLDRETGLVWEKSPSEILEPGSFAAARCSGETIGNRMGWRLPTVQELKSLIDPSKSNPALPPGHPFINLHHNLFAFDFYWSASVSSQTAIPADNLLQVSFAVYNSGGTAPRTGSSSARTWCVRGGQGALLQ